MHIAVQTGRDLTEDSAGELLEFATHTHWHRFGRGVRQGELPEFVLLYILAEIRLRVQVGRNARHLFYCTYWNRIGLGFRKGKCQN